MRSAEELDRKSASFRHSSDNPAPRSSAPLEAGVFLLLRTLFLIDLDHT
jgi:hypothetical protein